jgi:ketosteroid isomerase-like protein
MTDADMVRTLYRAYQDRAWDRAATVLHPDAVVVMSATAERLVGRPAVVDFQRCYPEPWGTLTVVRVLTDAEGAAAQVRVVDPAGREFALAAFWRSRDGLLHEGTEYWIEVGGEDPPADRADATASRAARRAWPG